MTVCVSLWFSGKSSGAREKEEEEGEEQNRRRQMPQQEEGEDRDSAEGTLQLLEFQKR